MGWDAFLFGELTFPRGGIEAWKTLVIKEGLYKDKVWKASSMMGDPSETATVAEMLVKLEDHARWCDEEYAGPDHQRVRIDGDRVSVRAYINEDDFRYWAGNIATMLRLGEKVGATGEYVALANDGNDGERLTLTGGTSRCELVDGLAVMTDDAYQAIIRELFDTTTDKMTKVTESRAAKKKVAAKKAPTKKAVAKKVPAKKVAAKKTRLRK